MMVSMSSGTLAKAPRRMLLSVSSRNQRSTKFSHDEVVGLFGPYASFSTKFLKNGSLTDLFGSVKGDTIKSLLAVGRDNWDLTDLIKEVLKSSARNDRIETGSQPIGHGRCVTGCIINRAGPDRDEHVLTIAFRCDKEIVQFVQPPFFKLGTRSPKDSPWFQERGGRVFSGADVIAYIATSWRERTSGLRSRSTRRPRG
jgi:hypothetical protein